MVTRASRVLWVEVNPEYQADPRDFTDADIAAGKLREADDADIAQNRAIVRRVLEAAFPGGWLPDDVRELLTDLGGGLTVEEPPPDVSAGSTRTRTSTGSPRWPCGLLSCWRSTARMAGRG